MNDQRPPSFAADKFIVRLPDGMRERIAEAAKNNRRSINAEIVARLQETFEGESDLHAALETVRSDIAAMREHGTSVTAQDLDRMRLQVDAIWKWTRRQPSQGLQMEDGEEEVVIGQVATPVPAKKARAKKR